MAPRLSWVEEIESHFSPSCVLLQKKFQIWEMKISLSPGFWGEIASVGTSGGKRTFWKMGHARKGEGEEEVALLEARGGGGGEQSRACIINNPTLLNMGKGSVCRRRNLFPRRRRRRRSDEESKLRNRVSVLSSRYVKKKTRGEEEKSYCGEGKTK